MKSKSTVCEEIVSPRYLPKHGRNERKVLNRTVCLLNLSNKFNSYIGHFVYSIDVHNTNILIVYVLFISFITSTWEGIRWGSRGITGEGKREKVLGKGWY
jgi:hypothetical protein